MNKRNMRMGTSSDDLELAQLARFCNHPNIDTLDEQISNVQISNVQQDRGTTKNFMWLKEMRETLGLTASGLAEKLNLKRQAISQFEESEKSGAISIKTMRKIAKAYECEFVYAFVPKNHNNFSEMLTAKVLPHVQKPKLNMPLYEGRLYHIFSHRITQFLKQPTGRGKVWNLKNAKKRPYNWALADYDLSYHSSK